MKKKSIIISLIVIVLIAGYGIGDYFVTYALSPSSSSVEREIDEKDKIVLQNDVANQIQKNKIQEKNKADQFEKNTQSTYCQSKDGIQLEGRYRLQKESHQWVILIHGYKSDNHNMMSQGFQYYKKGYNVVLPNNRAHDDSGGDYIGMGWLDKEDIKVWIQWIVKQDSKAQIIIHGVSMGGATTMMLSGDNVENVVGYIEDCGYTSVWDIFASELDKRFSLPTFPVLNLANMVAKMKAGYDFKEASSIEQVKKCRKPMLFIHGGKDDFVPVDMGYKVYEAAVCEKELFIVDQAGHAESKDYNPDAYWDKVFTFINEKITSQ